MNFEYEEVYKSKNIKTQTRDDVWQWLSNFGCCDESEK